MTSSVKEALEIALKKQMLPPAIPKEWDDEGGASKVEVVQTNGFHKTGNASHDTFYFVKANPGIKRTDALNRLVDLGYHPKTVGALLSQMRTQGMLVGAPAVGMSVTQDTYTAVKTYGAYAKVRNERERAQRAQEKREARKAAETAKPEKSEGKFVVAPAATSPWTAQAALDNLSVRQAKELYDELKKLFG